MTNKLSLFSSAREMFLKYGVKSVSMDDIANLLGISKKTIYQSVLNKKDLIQSVIETFVQEEHKAVKTITENSDNAVEEMVQIANHVMKSLKKMNPALTYDLKKYYPQTWSYLEKFHFSHIEQVIQRNLMRGKKEHLYREDINEEILAKMYVGMAQLIVNEQIFSFKKHEISVLFENYIEYHLNGIMNQNGKEIFIQYSQTEKA
jgi:AcrR family transcriptional regulator